MSWRGVINDGCWSSVRQPWCDVLDDKRRSRRALILVLVLFAVEAAAASAVPTTVGGKRESVTRSRRHVHMRRSFGSAVDAKDSRKLASDGEPDLERASSLASGRSQDVGKISWRETGVCATEPCDLGPGVRGDEDVGGSVFPIQTGSVVLTHADEDCSCGRLGRGKAGAGSTSLGRPAVAVPQPASAASSAESSSAGS